MASGTSIEWTESTWNPITGCTKISLGCKNCYAERMAIRLQAMGQRNYVNGFKLTTHPLVLDLPLKWKKPQTIFVNSMSDLFHEAIEDSFIEQVFSIIEQAQQHQFQILTKRAERLASFFVNKTLPDNAWIGVTVENKKDGLKRIDYLRTW